MRYMPKILFMTRSERQASTRYRVHQYLDGLNRDGFQTVVIPANRMTPRKRALLLSEAGSADLVFIQKKLFHPVFLRLLKALNSNIVFDFDDALFAREPYVRTLRKMSPGSRTAIGRLRAVLKVAKIVIAGNTFLSGYARKYCDRVHEVPTPVDCSRRLLPEDREDRDSHEVVLGWLGTSNNLYYLERLNPILKLIADNGYPIRLSVIADVRFEGRGFAVENVEWNPETESRWLREIDIGLMPLERDDWSRGKCAFKLLQYLSVGLSTVSSAVGMNREVIQDGMNGFLADSNAEWTEKLHSLITSPELRAAHGRMALKTVEKRYSLDVCSGRLRKILLDALE